MRISDWSSDVCSSDLEAMVRSNLWRRKDLFDRSPPFDPSRSGSAPFTRVYRPNGEHLAVIRPLSDSQRRMPTRSAGRARRGTEEIRSEEQTSELQSLMRISYAVFFLKNKIR